MSGNVACVAAGPNAGNGFRVGIGIRGPVKLPATISFAFDVRMRRRLPVHREGADTEPPMSNPKSKPKTKRSATGNGKHLPKAEPPVWKVQHQHQKLIPTLPLSGGSLR
jgi:hypothetical protein